jgi:hypothetical protein
MLQDRKCERGLVFDPWQNQARSFHSIPIRKLHKLAQQLYLQRVARVGVDAHVGLYDDECPPLGLVRCRHTGRKVNGEPGGASLIRLM